MKSIWNATRRDMCFSVGKLGLRLNPDQAARAWFFLSQRIEEMGDKDIPKFRDLITSYRAATIAAREKKP